MTEERLQDIENMIDAFDESLFISLYGYELDAPTVVDDFKYLIKRVQELESLVETSTYIQRRLRKQKKCYREALEEIKKDIQGDYTEDELSDYPLLEVIVEQIDKTLEGEE